MQIPYRLPSPWPIFQKVAGNSPTSGFLQQVYLAGNSPTSGIFRTSLL